MRQCIRKIGIFSLGMGSNAYRRKKKKEDTDCFYAGAKCGNPKLRVRCMRILNAMIMLRCQMSGMARCGHARGQS